jgi:Lrp/AsnC family transcriptional regulator for asnA, asnC and gidA
MSLLDSVDKQLLVLMSKDARQSSETIARNLNVSAATVRRRLSRLIKNGVLHIVGVADPATIGQGLGVVINLDVEHRHVNTIMKWLIDRAEIKWATVTTGRFDIVAIARFESTEHLARFFAEDLMGLKGIKDTETLVSLDVKKGRYTSHI